MDIKFDKKTKQYFLGKTGFSKEDFIAYIESDMLKSALDAEPIDFDVVDLENQPRLTGGTNVILYGVPGAGKSWTVEHDYLDSNTIATRVVFYPDYTYSDFVGQILPRKKGDSISYVFVSGPFVKALKSAFIHPDRKVVLIIEEVNRGNAPAIFGDLFQLLDRDENGRSIYQITNSDIARKVFQEESHPVYFPSNFSIICTMNTSDQNVFTLDTAFQRRWNMRMIENTFRKDDLIEKKLAEKSILDTTIRWETFCETINNQILEINQNLTSSEDKRLGTHFISLDELTIRDERDSVNGNMNKLMNRRFAEKVLKFLWDDAFKFNREEIFRDEYKSLELVIRCFMSETGDDRFKVFKESIMTLLFDKNQLKLTEK